jgi:hypothetical protein
MANLFNELAIQTSLRAGLISELQATETRILELCGKMRPAGIPTSEQPAAASAPVKRGRKPRSTVEIPAADGTTCGAAEALERADAEDAAGNDYRSPLQREKDAESPAPEPEHADAPDAKQNELIELLGAITLGIEMTTENLLNIAKKLRIIEDITQPVAKRYVGKLVEQLLGSGHLRRQGGGPATRYVRVK